VSFTGRSAGGRRGRTDPLDALILAAGLGTRLGEIGRDTPKALLEVGGRTMLEHVADRLVRAGVDRLVVNVHHHADRIAAFIAERDLGAEVALSEERERPLETGGALLHAAPLLRREAPFFVHNVDVLCEADLGALYREHVDAVEGPDASGAEPRPLATLVVNDRETRRHLLFDAWGLFGRSDSRKELRIEARSPRGPEQARAFAGIHVVEPALLDRITERGAFPILEMYLRLASEGERILPGPMGGARWMEIGNPDRLRAARAVFAAEGDGDVPSGGG